MVVELKFGPGISMIEAGWWGWSGVVERGGGVARLRRRRWGEEGADRWGLQISDRGERRRSGRKAQPKGEGTNSQGTNGTRAQWASEGDIVLWGKAGQHGRARMAGLGPGERFQMKIDF
jgi:hypothetical protein